jgi:hypothetical protein
MSIRPSFGLLCCLVMFVGTLACTGTRPSSGECSDGRDNDQDTRVDFPTDPGCDSADDAFELGPGRNELIASSFTPAAGSTIRPGSLVTFDQVFTCETNNWSAVELVFADTGELFFGLGGTSCRGAEVIRGPIGRTFVENLWRPLFETHNGRVVHWRFRIIDGVIPAQAQTLYSITVPASFVVSSN